MIAIDAGISPRLTPDEVAAQALVHIDGMERMAGQVARPPKIVSIRASSGAWGVQWHVRAEGTFVVMRPGRGSTRPAPAGSGYFLISDADGLIVGYGLP